MRGGFRRQVVPGVRISEVDLEATREEREAVAEDVRQRQFIAWLLEHSRYGVGAIYVNPLDIDLVEDSEDVEMDDTLGMVGEAA